MNSVFRRSLNGRHTYLGHVVEDGYDDAEPQIPKSNHWSSTENNANNAWNVNFGNGNVNNNNKNNSNVVRPSAALDAISMPDEFLESVYLAFLDCCKGKRSSTQCIEYMNIAEEDIPVLAREIWTDTYHPSTSTCFLVKYPKWREVFAANFRDRIVHHWLCMYIEPLFEQRFREQGDVSFNCRKGYGTNKAVQAVYDGIKRVTKNYQKDAWVFRGDLVGFFMSIDKNVMWRLMERFIIRKYHGEYKDIILRIAKIIIFHRPETDCVLNSPTHLWENLASNKSLHRNKEGRGMAIGNLTTQLFANFYLSFFDVYVQYVFRRENYCYARFVDDFVIVCDDRQFLLGKIDTLDDYLKEVLKLKMHHRKHYFQHTSHGVAFVGSMIKYGRIYLSNRTLARMQERIYGFEILLNSRHTPTSADIDRIMSVLNSYLGFTKGRCTYRRRRQLMRRLSPAFHKHFYIEGHYQKIQTRLRHKQLNINIYR